MKNLVLAIAAIIASATMSFASASNVNKVQNNPVSNYTVQLSHALNLSDSQAEEVEIYNANLAKSISESSELAPEVQQQMLKNALDANLGLMKGALTQDQYRKYVMLVNLTKNNNERLAQMNWQTETLNSVAER